MQFNGILAAPFTSNIGSPQGDGLSPILFAIYLEAAIQSLRSHGLVRPEADKLIGLPESLVYADDTDFVSFVREYLDRLITVLGPLFREDFKLIVNDDKTENTLVGHSDMEADQKAWRNTKKLGSLLGVEEDVTRRIQLKNVSLNKLEKLWKHRSLVALDVRLKAYRALVESILLYNCGTWA